MRAMMAGRRDGMVLHGGRPPRVPYTMVILRSHGPMNRFPVVNIAYTLPRSNRVLAFPDLA
jgi:hypothetical protein